MAPRTAPAGWTIENLGLIAAVRFRAQDGRELLWCDGEWRAGSAGLLRPAPGVPAAASMREARAVGAVFVAMADKEAGRV